MPRPRSSSSRAFAGRPLPVAAALGLVTLTMGRTDLHRAWGASPPQPTKGPYLTDLSDTRVEIRFELDSAAPASVTLHAQDDPGAARTIDDGSSAMHAVRASNLKAATTYAYTVRVGGAAAGAGQFTTAPAPTSGAPTTFLVYGDSRSDPTTHAALVRGMATTPADFLLNTGDVVAEGGRAADWRAFFQVEGPMLKDRALFLCIGNHELYDDEAGANFARYFGFREPHEASEAAEVAPYGTVRWSGVRLFFLNGMHDWQTGDERKWLERELARADDEAGLVWRIAVVHHGPWSSGPHGSNAKLLSARVPELLAAHHVDLVLSGHDHIYERGQVGALKYLVSGGGGAPLYPIQKRLASSPRAESVYHFIEVTASSDALHAVAHGIDGTTVDDCGFHKGGAWECDRSAPSVEMPSPSPPSSPEAGSSRCACLAPGASPSPGPLALAGALVMAGAAVVLRRRG
jgi:acid phosphatase type 7